MEKAIYNYDPSTGEFTGAGTADESPLEVGVLLIPAHATTIQPPPVGSSEVAVFDEAAQSWSVVKDYRGTKLFTTDGGTPIEVAAVGDKPEGTTDQPMPSQYHYWADDHWELNLNAVKTSRWEAIKAERDRRKSGGFKVRVGSSNKWFHSDADNRIQHLGLKDKARDLIAGGGQMTDKLTILGQTVKWKTMDGSFVDVSAQVIFDIVAAACDLDAQLFAAAETHRVAMEASADPASYDFSTGWPATFGGHL